MVAWKIKQCPRCGGDIYIDKDQERQWNEKCLQCGYMKYLISETGLIPAKREYPRKEDRR